MEEVRVQPGDMTGSCVAGEAADQGGGGGDASRAATPGGDKAPVIPVEVRATSQDVRFDSGDGLPLVGVGPTTRRSSPILPGPNYYKPERSYLIVDGRVYSGYLTQASYDLAPPHYWEGYECVPNWRGRMDFSNLQEDVLPVPPPPPPKPTFWSRIKVAWMRFIEVSSEEFERFGGGGKA